MTLDPAPSTALQSMRSSCDRCRFYKLKCTVPGESDTPVPCERCTRAKVPCVFGRRRRATRANAADARKQQQLSRLATRSASPVSSVQGPASGAATLATPRPAAAGGPALTTPDREATTAPAAQGQDLHMAGPVDCAPDKTATAASYDAYDGQPWERLAPGLLDAPDSTHIHVPGHQQSSHMQGIAGWDWLPHGFSLDDAFIMDDAYIMDADTDPLDPALRPPSPSPVLPAPGQHPTLDGTINTSDSATTTRINSGCPGSVTVPGQRLLALIADMQQRLRMLEEGPWQHDSARSLDDYPLGTVLHLSEEFGAVAGSVLAKACCAVGSPSSRTPGAASTGGDLRQTATTTTTTTKRDDIETWGEGAAGSRPGSGSGSGTGSVLGQTRVDDFDTATTLLVLVGYMRLLRIYGIVLGHFQVHLSRIPPGSNLNNPMPGRHHYHGGGGCSGSSAGTNTSTSPSLQLGELPCASAGPDLGRIHTAVCMLLAALHGVEDQLGRGGALARNLVVTLLTQEAVIRAGELQDGCGGLGGKVQSVKELLREKIGL